LNIIDGSGTWGEATTFCTDEADSTQALLGNGTGALDTHCNATIPLVVGVEDYSDTFG
jgi:hypothetical protein